MRESECIFCKIVAGEIPSHVVWEDEEHIAFLDIFPLRKAQTIVVPKSHVTSRIFALDEATYGKLMSAGQKVAKLLESALGAERTMLVAEGLEIDHAHLKLYPRFAGEGGLVHGGPPADSEGLRELAERIRGERK